MKAQPQAKPKKQGRPRQSAKQLKREIRRKLDAAKIGLAIAELAAAETKSAARRQTVAIARDLLPQAAAFARRGRPRLLAICARIIESEKLQPNFEAIRKA